MRYPGTDPKRLLHRVLMGPLVLERLPAPVIFLLLAGLAFLVGRLYASPVVALIWAIVCLLDWAMLAGLRRTGRSFGPVVPPLLALALLRFLTAWLLASTGLRWPLWLALAFYTALAWYGTWIEPLQITVTERELAFPQWPADAPPLRLLHVSDLHVERLGRLHQAVNEQVRQLAPDLICFTGDLLNLSYNSDPAAIEAARRMLSAWCPPLGVYAVTGSPLVDLPEAASAILGRLDNVRWLDDEAASAGQDGRALELVGVTCTHNPEQDGPRLAELLLDSARALPTLLLYHSPDLAPEAAAAGVDLHLAGHTHGGQIRAPLFGAIVTSSLYGKRYEMGEYRLPRPGGSPMTLYVSRGVGMEGGIAPRARFLCPPELILWTLRGSGPTEESAP